MGTLRGRTRMESAGGLVQASSKTDGWPTREGRHLITLIISGFLLSAFVSFAAVRLVLGPAGIAVVPTSMSETIVAFVATFAAALDIWAARRKRLSPAGLRRQTPKALLYSTIHPRLAVLMWGIDTGTAISTFRVSATTWVVFLAATLGLAPVWIGVPYALSFALPLIAALSWPLRDPDSPGRGTLKLTSRLHANVQKVQYMCSAALTGSALVLVLMGS